MWMCVITDSCPGTLYPQGKRPQYPLKGMLDGPKNWCGSFETEKILSPPSGIKA